MTSGRFLRRAWPTLFAAAVCCNTSSAVAHAPQARSAALTSNAAAIAIALPGFGILTRSQASQPFAYVCDAALAHQPSDLAPSLAFQSDGSLLVGTSDGLRILGPNRCPLDNAGNDLSGAVVVAVATHRETPNLAYAVTAGDRPGLWRSTDGGRRWQMRSPLTAADSISALLFDPSAPDTVNLSQTTTPDRASVLVSSNGGTSFTTIDQNRALRLLHRQPGTAGRLWAIAHATSTVSNRGFDILRADRPEGPWLAVLRINYFGGFAIDAAGGIWVGDEGGGVYRSRNGGDTFENVAPRAAVACLAYAGDALWACNPGTNEEPALMRWVDENASFEHVVAFTEVDHLVDCGAQPDIPTQCANAWLEWRRDVLMQNVSAPDVASIAPNDADASTVPDSGSMAPPAAPGTQPTAAQASNPAANASPEPTPPAASPAGCSIHRHGASTSPSWIASLLILLICRRLRSRHTLRRSART